MTVVALSTPLGISGIAVIRVSGEKVGEIIEKFLSGPNFQNSNFFPKTKKIYLAHFFDLNTKNILDQIQYVFYKSPHSYTGEDVLELFTHGNPFIINQIITSLLKIEGLRIANPGEFTRLALENGKIDLLQAEAIDQLIHGQNEVALGNAHSILQGKLSSSLINLKTSLDKLAMHLELDVDFVEEELEPNYSLWGEQFQHINQHLKRIESTWEFGRKLFHTPTIGLFGKPNAGKSSLLNSILGHDRLLVSEIAGTTRDYIEVPVQTNKGILKFIDTAGLGNPKDNLDEQAMEKTKQIWEELDYRIWVYDGRENPDEQLAEQNNVDPLKIDLKVATRKDLAEFCYPGNFNVMNLEKEKNCGTEVLIQYLSEKLLNLTTDQNEVVLSTQRQYQCIVKARQCIENALQSIKEKPRVEILAFEARSATSHLRDLVGEYHAEDVLNLVFANFCVGK